jgi:hypothetical protein
MDKKDQIKNPIDMLSDRMDKQDEVISQMRDLMGKINDTLNNGIPKIVETINKQSEELNKHAEIINSINDMVVGKVNEAQNSPSGQPSQQQSGLPVPQGNGDGMPDWMGNIVNFAMQKINGPKPTNLDSMVYNIVPQFFEGMFKGMLDQMDLVNGLLRKRVGSTIASAIGGDVGEVMDVGGFTK